MIAVYLLAGAVGALAFVGAIVASGVVGFRRGVDVGIEKGWQEAVQEDADFDAEWEGSSLPGLITGRAPIRRLQ